LASDPEAIKVKDWRHKLQRAFLIKGVPDATEMDTYDELFRSIENYAEMKLEYLQYSKIGKGGSGRLRRRVSADLCQC
jgi:hypothetical protein